MDVLFQSRKHFPEKAFLRTVELYEAKTGFLAVDPDIAEEVLETRLEGGDAVFIPAGQLMLCSRSTGVR